MENETKNTTAKKPKLMYRVLLGVGAFAIFTFGWAIGSGHISFNSGEQLASVIGENQPADLSVEGLQEIYDKLKANYDGKLNSQELVDGLKRGLVASVGDTYTEYLSKDETADFNSDLNGSFEGIGAELSKEDNLIIIVAPIKGAPAEEAGVEAQDIILEIDGEPTNNITVSEAVKKIRGKKGTKVKLTIVRSNGEQKEIEITRDTIDIPSVKWRTENDIGIIEIGRFGDDTVKLTEKAAQEFKDAGIKKVVLDVRGNPGGLLDAAVGVSNIWLPKGATILEEKRGEETIRTFTAPKEPILNGVETVVLIDKGSASASEIVAGALHDNKVATLIGETSYGKGSVQQLIDLDSGGSLKVTIARWYTPDNKNIDKEGIKPDTEVKMTAEEAKAKKDPQLAKAKAILNE